jgi:16S rRNA (guanine966-N2)-methyltransferase
VSRIIAGTRGGRRIATPKGAATRPTTDRVREALFARVQSWMDLEGAAVLDLFAGSGALGLEAASRGADPVLLVESDRVTAGVVRRNIQELDLAEVCSVRRDTVERVLRGRPGGTAYDLVLLDPPYPLGEAPLAKVLAALVTEAWLAPSALVVLERSSRSPAPAWPGGLVALEARAYGETTLHFADQGV